MRQPLPAKFVKQKPRQFKWTAWLPYPISWFRALVLVPLAFPVARLIVLGFTGTVMSAIGNVPVLLIFCLIFGLFLPTIFLSFPYHFFWFIWWQQPSPIRSSKWMPDSKSLWEAFCATVVTGISFLAILAIFTGIGVLVCHFSHATPEELGGCIRQVTERTARVIFSATDQAWKLNASGAIAGEKNNFAVQPWFATWLIVAAYLYQVEYLIKQRLIPWLKISILKYRFEHKAPKRKQ